MPSQRVTNKAWLCLSKEDGTVYCTHCKCNAGLGEVCSYVAAILFKIEMVMKLGLTKTSNAIELN